MVVRAFLALVVSFLLCGVGRADYILRTEVDVRIFPCDGVLNVFSTGTSGTTVIDAFAFKPAGSPTLPGDTTYDAGTWLLNGDRLSVWTGSGANAVLRLDVSVGATVVTSTLFSSSSGTGLQHRWGADYGEVDAPDPCAAGSSPIGTPGTKPCATAGCSSGGCGATACEIGDAGCSALGGCKVTCGVGYACCICGSCVCYINE